MYAAFKLRQSTMSKVPMERRKKEKNRQYFLLENDNIFPKMLSNTVLILVVCLDLDLSVCPTFCGFDENEQIRVC